MLAIKLRRIGKKHQSAFRIVVAEKRSKLGGKYVEDLGFYNPREKTSSVKKDRALYWIEKGAQPTDSIHNILVRAEVISAPKRAVHDEKGEKAATAERTKKAEESKLKAEEEARAKAEAEKATKEAEKEAKEAAKAEAEKAVEEAPVEEATEAAPEIAEEATEETPAE